MGAFAFTLPCQPEEVDLLPLVHGVTRCGCTNGSTGLG